MKDSEIIEDAIALLDEKGWIRLHNQSANGMYAGEALCRVMETGYGCVSTVIFNWNTRVHPNTDQFVRLGVLVSEHEAWGNGDESPIPGWNDNPFQTYDKVRERMVHVAKDLRNKGE